jgi:RNA polymerase sigma factor (sigma-70 family)
MDKSSKIAELFRKFIDGEAAAFSEIYKYYLNKLFRYGTIICNDKELVEDIIQDLFLKILNHPEKFRHISNYDVYLFKALKRNLQNKLSSSSRQTAILQKINTSHIQLEASTEEKYIEKEVLLATKKQLFQMIECLSPSHKEVIYLRFYEGLSYDQIATILSISYQVARNYASRALIKIRNSASKRKFIV